MYSKKARRSRDNITVDVAPGVTVTARRKSPTVLSNEAAYHKARSALLGSEVRALQKTLASGVIDMLSKQANSPEADGREFALQQQLTEAKITAAGVPLLTKQVQDIAGTLTKKERDWTRFLDRINTRFALLAKRYTIQRRQVRTPEDIASLNSQLQSGRDDLVNLGRQTKAQLTDDVARLQERFYDKRMELEKAVQAQRQAAVLQQELNSIQQTKRALTLTATAPIAARRSVPRLTSGSPRRSPRRSAPRRSTRRLPRRSSGSQGRSSTAARSVTRRSAASRSVTLRSRSSTGRRR